MEKKNAEPNHNENGEKNMFGLFSNDATNAKAPPAARNSFQEFLLRGVFTDMQKPAGLPHPMPPPPPHQMMENNNPQQEFQQPPGAHPSMMINHGTLSVEELESRLRQSGPPANNSANNVPNEVTAMKNSQQQDMIAFKKLVILSCI